MRTVNGVTLDELQERLVESGSSGGTVKRTTFNGLPAVQHRSKFKRLKEEFISESVVFDLDGRFVFFGLLTKPEDEAKVRSTFNEILNSVRRTDFGDAPGRRRYQTRRVKEGDTVASLVAESSFGEYAEAEFRSLNGLSAGQEPLVGSWIKLVE